MTHNPTPTDAQMKLADVTQADREAAAAAYANFLTAIRGEEGGSSLAAAFARHRQVTEARAQGLVETLENLLDDGHSYESEGQARDAARQALATWRRT